MASQDSDAQDPRVRQARPLSEFLKPPIESLLESLEDKLQTRISPFDLIQAYGLCSARVRRLSTALEGDNERGVALRYLKVNASTVLQCLARDIRKAMTVFLSERDERVADKHSKITLTAEEMEDARACAALSQNALSFVAQIASTSMLSEMWSGALSCTVLCTSSG